MRGNNVVGSQVGIILSDTRFITISQNEITDNSNNGILLEAMGAGANDNVTIIDNVILRNNGNGISIGSANNITIRNNIIGSHVRDGILVEYGTSNGTFTNNTIFDNENGISVLGLGLNTFFTNNTFFFNRAYGISLTSGTGQYKVLKNNFMENNLVRGFSQAHSNSPSNFFSHNFWTGHTTMDNNGDGIADVWYTIDGTGSNVDAEPVTSPHPNPFITFPTQLAVITPESRYLFTFDDNSLAGQLFNITLSWEITTNTPVIYEITRNNTLETTRLIFESSVIEYHDTLRIPSTSTTYLYNITAINIFGLQQLGQITVTFVFESELTSPITTNEGGSLLNLRIDGFLGLSLFVSLVTLAFIPKNSHVKESILLKKSLKTKHD